MHIGDVRTFEGVEPTKAQALKVLVEDASMLMLRCRRRNEERGRY